MCKIFVQVAGKAGRPRSKNRRVMLGGALVDAKTKRIIERLAPQAGNVGRLHDQVYAFVKLAGFKPTKSIP
jgi:hypothetical protein